MDPSIENLAALSLDLGYRYSVVVTNGMFILITHNHRDWEHPYEEIFSDDDPHRFTQRVEKFLGQTHYEGEAASDRGETGSRPGDAPGRAA